MIQTARSLGAGKTAGRHPSKLVRFHGVASVFLRLQSEKAAVSLVIHKDQLAAQDATVSTAMNRISTK